MQYKKYLQVLSHQDELSIRTNLPQKFSFQFVSATTTLAPQALTE